MSVSRRSALAIAAVSPLVSAQGLNRIAQLASSTRLTNTSTEAIVSSVHVKDSNVSLIYDRTTGTGRIAHTDNHGQLVRVIELRDPGFYTTVGCSVGVAYYVWQKRLGRPPQLLRFNAEGKDLAPFLLSAAMEDEPVGIVNGTMLLRSLQASVKLLELESRKESRLERISFARADVHESSAGIEIVDLVDARVHRIELDRKTSRSVDFHGQPILNARSYLESRRPQYGNQAQGVRSVANVIICSAIHPDGAMRVILAPINRAAPVTIFAAGADGSTVGKFEVMLLGADRRKFPPRWMYFSDRETLGLVNADGHIDVYKV